MATEDLAADLVGGIVDLFGFYLLHYLFCVYSQPRIGTCTNITSWPFIQARAAERGVGDAITAMHGDFRG